MAAFAAEAQAAQSIGLAAEVLDQAPLPFRTTGALRFPQQSQFNPVRYLEGLAKAFVAAGGHLFEGSRVRLVDEASRWRVVTDKGNVHAQNVVVATNLTIKSPVGMSKRTQPRMHTAMAFRIDREIIDGMFLGIDEPAHSLRTGNDATGRLLVVLGPKFETGHEPDVAGRLSDLEGWVRGNLAVGATLTSWCNEDYDTADRVAYAGEPDPEKAPGFFIATGFNAWGISNGTAAGMLIADKIAGTESSWEKLYDPSRSSKEINKGGESASLVTNIDAIAPEQGGVFLEGGKPIAVWKSKDGTAHRLSAECTHKGCTVTWNNAARTWDCPCHGSMFSKTGTVLHGPARTDLKPIGED